MNNLIILIFYKPKAHRIAQHVISPQMVHYNHLASLIDTKSNWGVENFSWSLAWVTQNSTSTPCNKKLSFHFFC